MDRPSDLMSPRGARSMHRGGRRSLPARALALSAAVVLLSALAGCAVTLGSPAGSGSGTAIPVKVLQGGDNATLVEVPIYVGSHGPYQFVLDTGASISLIDRSIARDLNLPRSGARQPVSGVGGVEQVSFVSISQWRMGSSGGGGGSSGHSGSAGSAGGVALPKTTIASGALPVDRNGPAIQGLLGSDVLHQFGRITLDYSAATLTVYRQIGG